ncbi:DUF547 domain-containing protein [Hymenobacter busanensis]|uniref:DUF547 domain-containing protein n=1 Tax=Hymenobacter busanensis TaxID=2607656 RepID=A0A7L4ZW38_9BACT|nr:DUF547 domain-containing protein [Hymenobacter busanensis]KAA9332416.1 DUF547 domain-containing protein [Hymenobacter busanensis]QHJ07247.1 DUF547 domain-containing protein [Hymenobacter busanensis]
MLHRLPARVTLFLLFGLLLLNGRPASADNNTLQLLHAPWGELLARHLRADGHLNYQGLQNDEDELLAYLQAAKHMPPQPSWSRADQAAYWLNVYNATSVYLTLQYYPVERLSEVRIKTIGGKLSVWEAPEVNVGNQTYSLNQIERTILPKLLPADARLHFALNRGAYSGPSLLPAAFDGALLDKQLDQQARRFINDPLRNTLAAGHVQVSSLFDWHAAEFGQQTELVAFLNRYAKIKIEPTAQVTYLPFDWALNDNSAPDATAQRGTQR